MLSKKDLLKVINDANETLEDIDNLIFEKKYYSRMSDIDWSAVNDYSQNIATIPPIIVNQNMKIVDGVHRYKALLKKEQTQARVKIIDMDDDDLQLAGLLIDIDSGVRHSEKDKKSVVLNYYDVECPDDNKRLMKELNVPESTFYLWTADKRKEQEKRLNKAIVMELLDPFHANEAEEIAEIFGCSKSTIMRIKNSISVKIPTLGELTPDELEEENLDFLIPYKEFIENELLIYNIWNTPKGDETSHFGHFPIKFMKNLLYYHTEPFDFVYDPFAGSGTTTDACKQMFRKYHTTDLVPDKSREEILFHDIKNGLPDNLPKPKLVFLDPPYWLQAKGKYSDSENDLSNMDLESFYKTFNEFLGCLMKRKIEKIAVVIQPTQYLNENHKFEDHIFKFHEALMDKYEIEMRYILPYSTQQYNAQQVEEMKKEKKCMALNRDLIIWRKL